MSTLGNAAQAGLQGAATGSALGPWGAGIGALIGAGGSIAGGLLGGDPKQTPMQKQQQQLLDQLLASINGGGPFSHLFNMSDEAFQKSYVDPAKSLFKNQIAPQIQQQYIASGQQRGTGLDDQLLRAGVDLDQMLNQQFAQMQQGAQQNQLGAINTILGAGPGAQGPMSFADKLKGASSGYLTSDAFPKGIESILDTFRSKDQLQAKGGTINKGTPERTPPKGYTND